LTGLDPGIPAIGGFDMAEKKAKTAEKSGGQIERKRVCPTCGADGKVTLFAGYGRKGFYVVCEKACGFVGPVR
jgi:hypothetical protein